MSGRVPMNSSSSGYTEVSQYSYYDSESEVDSGRQTRTLIKSRQYAYPEAGLGRCKSGTHSKRAVGRRTMGATFSRSKGMSDGVSNGGRNSSPSPFPKRGLPGAGVRD